jgi:tetratricopeptide (TPR) repeat protein
MKCPVCGAVYRPTMESGEYKREQSNAVAPPQSLNCRRCKADLSDLIRLHDEAIWYHRQALSLLQQDCYTLAEASNNQALALHYSNAHFHALAGKLSALQGNFSSAVASWQQALKFDSKNAIASTGLEMMEMLQKSEMGYC